MMQATRWWFGPLTIGVMLFAFVGSTGAQTDKKPHDGSALNESLRDVINAGAKMFNEQGDHAGCYRLYQGSLLSVRPFLAKDLQAKIDAGLANAEKMPFFADRAFELRRVLDEVRASTKGKGDTKTAAVAGDKGQVAGKLSFEGKPVPGGYFVSLVSVDGKKVGTTINKDGTFQIKTPISAGEYRVIIEPIPDPAFKGVSILPTRYSSVDTSGLAIRVESGSQQVDFHLVK